MKGVVKVAFVIVYLVGWFVTWGAGVASDKVMFPRLYNKHECRESIGFFGVWAAVPVGPWVVEAAMSGGYQDGFQWSCAEAPVLNYYGYSN